MDLKLERLLLKVVDKLQRDQTREEYSYKERSLFQRSEYNDLIHWSREKRNG